ncbi:RraA family protein [Prauserella cavernicola]|uniref:Putative 4-hydroxy-4-methyl-2-oxoglutarate aldolase n=1 Tax=Prauserella cavernicola TaxID=2800127 RepID=A0A934V5F8_9PSEU|nr:RraA family protein [Prauserella cavernicola]MBK1789431.1 RraA family protein [Prauserella cavernicola]
MADTLAAEYDEYLAEGRIWGLVDRERIKKIKFPRVSQNIVQRYLAVSDLTTSVSDVLDSLGIVGAVPASYLRPLAHGQKVVGPAVTIRNLVERKTPTQGYHDKDFIRMSTRDIYYLAEPGDVLVTDTGGDLSISNMGAQSCTVAQSRGLAGSIVYGAVRDAGSIRELGYPVWSCGVTPLTGKFRIEAIEMNGPVTLHDVRVEPGDLMIADDSGVCVVPFEHVEHVIDEIESIAAAEERMTNLIVEGAPISELKPLFRKRYSS